MEVFDGKSLDGWWIGTESPHGSGGIWDVRDGAIIANTDNGNGGQLFLNEQYADFEIRFKFWPDWGNDSGLYLRSTRNGHGYQAVIDYYEGHSIGGLYGEQIGGWIHRNFDLQAETIISQTYNGYDALREAWSGLWDPDGFNDMHVGVKGSPPLVKVWVNGVLVCEHQVASEHGDLSWQGYTGFQVHGNLDRWRGGENRFKDVFIRELGPDDQILGPEGVQDDPVAIRTRLARATHRVEVGSWYCTDLAGRRLSAAARAGFARGVYLLHYSDAGGQVRTITRLNVR
ncbi:MAG: DUF1080 domain-containing protein [Chitinivibrionales bacterium]|nr:DUF1080 domain-containing protein [Chitinivibrionales bacterium]